MTKKSITEFIVTGVLTYGDLLSMMAEITSSTNTTKFVFNLEKMTGQEDGDSFESLMSGIVFPLLEKGQLYDFPILPNTPLDLTCIIITTEMLESFLEEHRTKVSLGISKN